MLGLIQNQAEERENKPNEEVIEIMDKENMPEMQSDKKSFVPWISYLNNIASQMEQDHRVLPFSAWAGWNKIISHNLRDSDWKNIFYQKINSLVQFLQRSAVFNSGPFYGLFKCRKL